MQIKWEWWFVEFRSCNISEVIKCNRIIYIVEMGVVKYLRDLYLIEHTVVFTASVLFTSIYYFVSPTRLSGGHEFPHFQLGKFDNLPQVPKMIICQANIWSTLGLIPKVVLVPLHQFEPESLVLCYNFPLPFRLCSPKWNLSPWEVEVEGSGVLI